MPNESKAITDIVNLAVSLDPASQTEEIQSLFDDARKLIVQEQNPKQWAAVHGQFGDLLFGVKPAAAIEAYRVAISIFNEVEDEYIWAHCHGQIGMLLMQQCATDPEVLEEAIKDLEIGFRVNPDLSSMLAYAYSLRMRGDRLENWRKRIEYLTLAVAAIDPQVAPAVWAARNNELAMAWPQEPNGDFAQSTEKQIAGLLASLSLVENIVGEQRIRTKTFLSQSFLFRVYGDAAENLAAAKKFGREAVEHCDQQATGETHRMAIQAWVQACTIADDIDSQMADKLLIQLNQAESLIDATINREAAADIHRSRANILYQCILKGEHQRLGALIKSTQLAIKLLDGRHPQRALTLNRIEGEARFEVGDFAGAIKPLSELLNIGHQWLGESQSMEGRLETISTMGSAAATLCYCYIKLGHLERALASLERGKALLWNDRNDGSAAERVAALIPENGALLFGCFAGREGAVIAVTKSQTDVIHLPEFGRAQVMLLQRGGEDATELGGWLNDYLRSNESPLLWRDSIHAIGGVLYKAIWLPVLTQLNRMGISEGAELVWFHQGGTNLFPIHAAWYALGDEFKWLLDDYAIRVAPSIQVLLSTQGRKNKKSTALIVSDPNDDIFGEEVEIAWIEEALRDSKNVVLRGANATKETVLNLMNRVDVAHFSTHADFDFSDPWQSGLVLANRARLTVQDCVSSFNGSAPALVSLSACATGVTKVTANADEFLGLAMIFLHAGTKTIVASMWPVEQLSTALLIGRFYRELAKGDRPAQALRLAQNWLRKSTAAELREALKPLTKAEDRTAEVTREFRNQLFLKTDSRPFSSPFYWAGFSVIGH